MEELRSKVDCSIGVAAVEETTATLEEQWSRPTTASERQLPPEAPAASEVAGAASSGGYQVASGEVAVGPDRSLELRIGHCGGKRRRPI